MKKNKNFKRLVIFAIAVTMCLSASVVLPISSSVEFEEQNNIEMNILDSPPYPPGDTSDTIVDRNNLYSSGTLPPVILPNVPSSTWTYGCSATSAGMLFGYYDRTTHPNMYTGPCNGGVCPLSGLGQGSKDQPGATGYPVAGSCYIIATENGFDGITTTGHADAFYTVFGATGDPASKTWSLCTADYLGTNQWKWNYITPPPPPITVNIDGATTLWTSSNGAKLYDYIPAANCGMPQTSFCHGCKLFAQSRGYTVTTNYNQLTDNQNPSGFTFNNFKAEIDAGRPVVVHVVGHTMLGLGYDVATTSIYFHDTWDNNLHFMTWGGSYIGMALRAVTVIQLQSTGNNPPNPPTNPSPSNGATGVSTSPTLSVYVSDPNLNSMDVTFYDASNSNLIGTATNVASGGTASTTWSGLNFNTQYSWYAKANDKLGGITQSSTWSFTTQAQPNTPPSQPTTPTGQTSSCKVNTPYPYSTSANDLDSGDRVKYGWDWTGDGVVDLWDDNGGSYYTPGTPITTQITWTSTQTTYSLRVIAEDLQGAQSPWSLPISVTTPKNKAINTPFLDFLQNHPHMFPLLQHLLQLLKL